LPFETSARLWVKPRDGSGLRSGRGPYLRAVSARLLGVTGPGQGPLGSSGPMPTWWPLCSAPFGCLTCC